MGGAGKFIPGQGGGGILGMAAGAKEGKTMSSSGWTPQQTALANQMSQYYGENLGAYRPQLDQLMSGQPSTQVNPAATREFFQRNIYEPAMQEYQDVTVPTLGEQMGQNYWSTARRGAEQKALQGTQQMLAKNLADLQYKDEQARRGLQESAMNRMLQAYQFTPEMMATRLLSQQPISTAYMPSQGAFGLGLLGL